MFPCNNSTSQTDLGIPGNGTGRSSGSAPRQLEPDAGECNSTQRPATTLGLFRSRFGRMGIGHTWLESNASRCGVFPATASRIGTTIQEDFETWQTCSLSVYDLLYLLVDAVYVKLHADRGVQRSHQYQALRAVRPGRPGSGGRYSLVGRRLICGTCRKRT